jgi:3-oxochol-4-en-24-oyl-CoA dehydrogenase
MGIAIDEADKALEAVAAAFLEKHDARGAGRALLDAPEAGLPPFWPQLVELGWLGLHLPEEYGGQGAELLELGVVVEQMGRHVAPGPFITTVLASAVIEAVGSAEQKSEYLPLLATGALLGTVSVTSGLTRAGNAVNGDAGLVLGAGLADVLLLPVGDSGGRDLVIVDARAPGLALHPTRNLDPTRRVARVTCAGVACKDTDLLRGGHAASLRLGRALAAAEASGLAHACVEMASGYAKVREQFGRAIGTFQAVKHHCANMLVDAEVTTALAADALSCAQDGTADADLSCAAAAGIGLPAATRCAKLNSQVHGGISYTWEHDCHLYVRRAQALQAIFGPAAVAQKDVARFALAGATRRPRIDLPADADTIRDEVRSVAERLRSLPEADQRKELVDAGYAFPHWPRPWGRSAGPIEQLVIEEEFADIPRPQLGIGGWITQTLATHGTPEQTERWIRQSLLGEITWCQLFSEPNAGSDAASIQTSGTRTTGGWLVSGQKLWTTGANRVSNGFITVRTDRDAPKHRGITTMVVEMSDPGINVRPLRDITGNFHFNEVFLENVFIPDDDVVGRVNDGWTVARATLGAERVSIGAGHAGGDGTELFPILARFAAHDDGHVQRVGVLIAQSLALRLLNLRQVARAVSGGGPGPEGNVTKLLTAERRQAATELVLELLGPAALDLDAEETSVLSFLQARQATISGGTSEITRNQVGERLLGLPRDPLLQ